MDYRDKIILAPMVRVGILPMRLLCLKYGADFVYGEEIIDRKMLQCQRRVNSVLSTVDFVSPEEAYPVFQTCSYEKDKVVFQMGTCDPERALSVAKLVENDVSAIDINMGCPKSFSIQGGMGAALLTQAEKVESILTTLVKGVKIPVSCKIRILPDLNDTINLAKIIERCGVAALAVHGRTKEERPQHENHYDVIREVARSLSIPVIANGGSKFINQYQDIKKFQQATETSSVMVARSAMLNPSVFRSSGLLDIETVIKDYLTYCCDYDSNPALVKYTLQLFLQSALHTTEPGLKLLDAKSLREICKIWDMDDYYEKQRAKQRDRAMRPSRDFDNQPLNTLDWSNFHLENAFCLNIPFTRKYFDNILPKMILHEYCKRNSLKEPIYTTHTHCKSFLSTVEIDDKRYASVSRGKNKRFAEQASAIVAIIALKLHNSLPESSLIDVPWDEVEAKLGR